MFSLRRCSLDVRALDGRGRSFALGLALLAVAAGCAPASVRDCTLKRGAGNSLLATGAFTNHSSKTIVELTDVLFYTSDGIQGYPFPTHIEPGETAVVSKEQPIVRGGIVRAGKVSSCRVHAITYADGTQWWGPSDM